MFRTISGIPVTDPCNITTGKFSPNWLKLGAAINSQDLTFMTRNTTPVVSFSDPSGSRRSFDPLLGTLEWLSSTHRISDLDQGAV